MKKIDPIVLGHNQFFGIIVIVSNFYTSRGFLKTTIKTYLANEHIV